jgi:hypothetical protein
LRFKFLLVGAIGCIAACFAAGQSSPAQRPNHRAQAAVKDPPAAPAAPLSPEQLPAAPPQVAFNGGIMTIVANNSTLGDILRAVHRQTGASVDVPGNATERVIGQFGPGPVRDVLSLLLNGSHFNYVLLGSATNPNALDRVMLLSKPAGADQPAQQANAQQFPPPTPQAADNADSADDAADTMQDNDQPDDQANQAQPDDQQQQQPPQANPFGQPGGGVKTPEQLLQELQQRQQQMQQQQQQQQQGGPQSFPPTPLSPSQPPQSQPQ